ncbi:MAG: hypothetical protein KO202_05305 [Methanobacteriaceae archaeon]|jgi:hypothetical protein|nr:hypothetical protein [Methanobacteriaceae archaeon]
MNFVDVFFDNDIDLELGEKGGRPIFPKKSLLKIVLYGEINRVKLIEDLSDLVMNHYYYKFVADNLKPSSRTLRRFKNEYGFLLEFVLQSTLIKAKNDELIDFDHIAVDGTIIKVNNSNYNIIKLMKLICY